MIKLACNIAMYHPDVRVLAARYRSWHVKPLLDEAAVLIDRCIQDFKEFSSYDYAWNKFQLDLKIQEKEIDLHRAGSEEPSPAETAAPQEETEASEIPEGGEETSEAEGAAEEESAPESAEAAFAPPSTPKTTIELQSEAVQRKKELSSPGQPLALNDHRDVTLTRLCRDYEQAVDRAWVAEQGLRKIYDHADLSSPLPTEAETLTESITNLAIWIRNASEWLTRYEQHEETFTRVISLRSFLGRTAWSVLKQSRDSYGTKLRIPPEIFRTHDNCHIKGVSAWLVGDVGTVPWSMVVRLPEEAVYERWGQSVEVDQSGRASCLLGRVENRKSTHPPQICGANTLVNASPIGQGTPGGYWLLEVYKPSGAVSESFGHLEDIVLEINASGIPQRSMS